MRGGKRFHALLALSSAVLVLSVAARSDEPQGQERSQEDLERAVAALRHIVPGRLSEAEEQTKGQELDDAWLTIQSHGNEGALRLKREIAQLESTGEKDHFFALGASALLWRMGGLEHAETIAEIWNSTPVHVQYLYVFYTAFEAAKTQDQRALPMLTACLRDKQGSIFVSRHSMRVAWPLSHEFLWGTFGPQGLATLNTILNSSKNVVEVESAIVLLSKGQYLEALPAIRRVAAEAEGDVAATAIRCLGMYGHPQDYEFLIAGLRSGDPSELHQYAFALFEYGDLRAVPHFVPLLKAEDAALRYEVIAALTQLLTPRGFEAIHEHSTGTQDEDERKLCQKFVGKVLEDLNVTLDAYSTKSAEEKAALLAALRKRFEERYVLKEGERRLTHNQFVEAAEEWKTSHRITEGKYRWVEARHATTPAGIGLLLEVKAFLYWRLSDECLYEVRRIDELVKRLSRRRYRRAVGVCDKVEGNAEAPR